MVGVLISFERTNKEVEKIEAALALALAAEEEVVVRGVNDYSYSYKNSSPTALLLCDL